TRPAPPAQAFVRCRQCASRRRSYSPQCRPGAPRHPLLHGNGRPGVVCPPHGSQPNIPETLARGRRPTELRRMTSKQLQGCSKKVLSAMARRKGITGWHEMRKEELVEALAARGAAKGPRRVAGGARAGHNGKGKARHGARPQLAAARNTGNGISGEELVERSKFDVGVPTKDLSAKVAKDLPAGYGKDRIVVMVRDPYWLHAYWEVTRQAVQRAEAALGQQWHGAKPILRLLDVTAHDTTPAAQAIV